MVTGVFHPRPALVGVTGGSITRGSVNGAHRSLNTSPSGPFCPQNFQPTHIRPLRTQQIATLPDPVFPATSLNVSPFGHNPHHPSSFLQHRFYHTIFFPFVLPPRCREAIQLPATTFYSIAQILYQTCLALERKSHLHTTRPLAVRTKPQTGMSASHHTNRQVQSSFYFCSIISSPGDGPLVDFQGRRKTVDACKVPGGCAPTSRRGTSRGVVAKSQPPRHTIPPQDISGPVIPNAPTLGCRAGPSWRPRLR